MKKIILALAIVIGSMSTTAQQLWTSADVKIPITKRITATVEAEYRTHNKLSSSERWALSAALAYRPTSHLKFDIGYKFINSYTEDEFHTKKTLPPLLHPGIHAEAQPYFSIGHRVDKTRQVSIVTTRALPVHSSQQQRLYTLLYKQFNAEPHIIQRRFSQYRLQTGACESSKGQTFAALTY